METANREFYLSGKRVSFETFMEKMEEFFGENEDVYEINNLLINGKFDMRVRDVVVEDGKIKRVEE